MTSITNSDLGGAPRSPPLLWSHPPPRLPTRQLQELLNCGCGICQREWVFLVEQTQTLLRALKRVRNPTVAYPFDTCVCLHNCDALENAYATHHNPQSDFGFFEGRYDFAAELASGRAQEAQEAVNAALCRQPIPTAPHTEETIRSWNEAKALFGIAPDEEPGQIPVEAIAQPSPPVLASLSASSTFNTGRVRRPRVQPTVDLAPPFTKRPLPAAPPRTIYGAQPYFGPYPTVAPGFSMFHGAPYTPADLQQ